MDPNAQPPETAAPPEAAAETAPAPEARPAEAAPAAEAPPAPLSPLDLLREAMEKGEPVPGTVVGQRGKLGLDVDLGGGFVVLCPMDEVDLRHQKNPGKLVGEKLLFQVKEATEASILVSQRAQLARESDARARAAREKAVPGAILEGKVVSLQPFGAFVDIGGIEGLIHLSELSADRVAHPREVLKVGETVKVQVVEVRHDPVKGDRIALSRKAIAPSAWDQATAELAVGQKIAGKIARVVKWGVFVEILPDVQGLVHVSALSPARFERPSELVKTGDPIEVEVTEVDRVKKRISLRRIPTEAEVAAADADHAAVREAKRLERLAEKERKARAKLPAHERLKAGEIVDATVDRLEPYGAFVKIAGGGRGMIHVSEAGLPEGGTLEKDLPPGTKLRAAVIEIATDPTPRIRLSRKAVAEIEGGKSAESYVAEKALLAAAEAPARRGPRPGAPRKAGARPKEAGAPAGKAEGGEKPRRERKGPPRERPAGPRVGDGSAGRRAEAEAGGHGGRSKPGKLGTLGDLFKAKLAAKKG